MFVLFVILLRLWGGKDFSDFVLCDLKVGLYAKQNAKQDSDPILAMPLYPVSRSPITVIATSSYDCSPQGDEMHIDDAVIAANREAARAIAGSHTRDNHADVSRNIVCVKGFFEFCIAYVSLSRIYSLCQGVL